MQINHLLIRHDSGLDILSSVRIFECVHRLLVLSCNGRYISNHDCFTVPTERILEQSCEL